MPVERVIVDVDLGVQRVDLAVFRQDERVDFGQRRVNSIVGLSERGHGGHRCIDARCGDAHPEREIPALKRSQAVTGFERFAQNQFRRFGSHLFDLHSARGRCHEHWFAVRTVEHDT